MMKSLLWIVIIGLASCALAYSAEVAEGKIALDQVPQAVREAAQKAVKDIVLTEAEKETKGTDVMYELEGVAGEKKYEIKVSAAGKVLKVKLEDDD